MVCMKGVAAFVYPKYHNQIFAIVSGDYPEIDDALEDHERLVIPHCGFEDTVMSHLFCLREMEELSVSNPSQDEIGRQMDKREFSQRTFSVQSITDTEFLTLTN